MQANTQETLTAMTAKVAPPASVIGANWLGFSVPEWIQLLTLIYVVLLVLHKLFEMVRDGWKWWKDEHEVHKP